MVEIGATVHPGRYYLQLTAGDVDTGGFLGFSEGASVVSGCKRISWPLVQVMTLNTDPATLANQTTLLGRLPANLPEIAQGIPSATPTPADAWMLVYMALRNKLVTTPSEYAVYDDAGTKIAKKAITVVDGVSYTEAEMISGA